MIIPAVVVAAAAAAVEAIAAESYISPTSSWQRESSSSTGL
jgi:hypothetical protein